MDLLYDAAGQTCWISVKQSETIRYLELNGCEEGAMYRQSDDPVFRYLWFHHCSRLAAQARRLLVLGAGAFTAPKCLALNHSEARIDVVDMEPDLEHVARRFFRLDRPYYARIAFHGLLAEAFLKSAAPPYDFVFDDLFDGFQHVPDQSRTRAHFEQARSLLGGDAIFVKNVIWSSNSAHARAACEEAQQTLADVFRHHLVLALGKPDLGHNRLLIGSTGQVPLQWKAMKALFKGSVPAHVLETAEAL
jgi:spermidine synthase